MQARERIEGHVQLRSLIAMHAWFAWARMILQLLLCEPGTDTHFEIVTMPCRMTDQCNKYYCMAVDKIR